MDSADSATCWLCSDEIEYEARYGCGHATCYRCATRMRALLKSTACPICRADSVVVHVRKKATESSDPDLTRTITTLRDLSMTEFHHTKLAMVFSSKSVEDVCISLLAFNCPAPGCGQIRSGWRDLKIHTVEAHDGHICDLCSKHTASFTSELALYSKKELRDHARKGDKKRGVAPHPHCDFCNQRFFSDVELYSHCRDKHEKCHLCEREAVSVQGAGTHYRPQYFQNYDDLAQHFVARHHACGVQKCLDAKFVVFATAVELQKHMLEEHADLVGSGAAGRMARRLDLYGTDFQSQLSTVDPTATANNNSRNSTRQPASMSIEAFPELGSTTTRASDARARAGTSAGSTANPSSSTANTSADANATAYHSTMPDNRDTEDIVQRRLEERAKISLGHKADQIDKFRDMARFFDQDHLSAAELAQQLRELFDAAQTELLIHEFGRLYQLRAKGKTRQAAQAKVEALKTEETRLNEHNQALAATKAAPAFGSASAPVSSGNTRSSSPVPVTPAYITSSTTWGTRVYSNLNATDAFPELPRASSVKMQPLSRGSPRNSSSSSPVLNGYTGVGRAAAAATQVAATRAQTRTTTSTYIAASTSASAGPTRTVSPADFPALPPVAKRAPPVRQPVGSASSSSSSGSQWARRLSDNAPEPVEDLVPKGRKKGKKVVLYQFGL